jgi:hypothetical protein
MKKVHIYIYYLSKLRILISADPISNIYICPHIRINSYRQKVISPTLYWLQVQAVQYCREVWNPALVKGSAVRTRHVKYFVGRPRSIQFQLATLKLQSRAAISLLQEH